MRKRFLNLFVSFVFLFAIGGMLIQTIDAAQAAQRGFPKQLSEKVEAKVLEEISSKGKTNFWVILRDKADLKPAYGKMDADRGKFVFEQLRSVADKSQAGLRAMLASAGVKYRPYWIINAIHVSDGGAGLVNQIAARPDVESIRAGFTYILPKPIPGREQNKVLTVEWGIDNINADDVWNSLGFRGEGIVVANVDTGFQFDHSALVAKYRGNLGGGSFDHNYNWFDPSAICGPGVPCDNNGHGTHTMGTMVGDDGDPGTNQIGVAPHAQFMGCKGCETNSCSDTALLGCGQFILAPTDVDGNNPDPNLRPHIVNNSWGGGGGDTFYQATVDAWEASGIFPQFSNGNGGPGCGSSGSPGDFVNTYSAGAYDINNVIAVFSSRGPSAFGGEIKPNISAPGVDVRSSFPGNTYGSISGTSMASPHVAGTIALMWSAAPALVRDIATTRQILDDTAVDVNDTSCGGDADDNNVWGEGRLDAFQAVSNSPICALGTLSGTVTDSGTLAPIEGALVEATGGPVDRSATTDSSGNYTMDVCEGTYDVTASAFGYLPETVNGVVVTPATNTDLDFALDQAPISTVSGTVFDNSGHGWGLYARIDIDGYPGGPVFTNPLDGTYSVDLPQGTIFPFHVSAVTPGYLPETRDVDPGANPTEDFGLVVDGGTCNAPGYGFGSASSVFFDDFEGGFGNWSMDGLWNPENEADTCGSIIAPFPSPTNAAYYGIDGVCTFNNGDTNSGSLTMITPVSVPSSGSASLTLYSYEQTECGGPSCPYDGRFVDVSTDGGSSWTQVGDLGNENTWYQATVSLAAYSGQDILVRFRFDTLDGAVNDFFGWMVDSVDVSVTACEAIPGGLIVGNVYDQITGLGLNGASVTSDEVPTDTTTTFGTPEDPALDEGFYVLFSSLTGVHDFTASKNLYGSQTLPIDVLADDVVEQDFQLGTGHLVVTPTEIDETVDLGTQVTVQLTVTNDGSADATFEILENNGHASIRVRDKVEGKGAPTKRIKGHFSPLSKVEFDRKFKGKNSLDKKADRKSKRGPNDPPWTDIAGYPNAIMDSAAVEVGGLIYNVNGLDGGLSFLNTLFAYDPGTDSWTQLASSTAARERPAVAAINGLIYVTNGWDSGGSPTGSLEIYDPSTDSWSTGAPIPVPMGGGSTGVTFDGKFYVIGGCDSFSCGFTNVQVYDPSTDSWSAAADYPEPISWNGCGDVGGTIVCAGGTATGTTANTYSYDPGSDSWSPVAPMPQDQWAMGYVASGGQLYISGGVTDGFSTITNEGFAYDPGADTWTPIENSNNVVYRGAGACGFYKIGGSIGGFSPIPNSEVYPGLTDCGGSVDVPWLSENPVTATVPANGGQVIVDVTLDAAQVAQPGVYLAHLTFKTDTPFPAQKVNVTMTVPLPGNFGTLNGTVTGLGQCDAPGAPIEGATVFVDGPLEDFTLTTDANGFYTWSFDAANSPVDITVSAPGYIGESATGVVITAGQTTTVDFELRLDAPCLSVAPTALDVTLNFGEQQTEQITIMNTGAGDANFKIREANAAPFRTPKLPKAVSKADKKRMAMTGPTSVRTLKNASKEKVKALFPAINTPDVWIPGDPIPQGIIRYAHAQCEENPESFYVISGVDPGFGLSPFMTRYDSDTNTWTPLANVPSPSEAPTAVCFEGKIYVAVGAFTSNEFQVYDVATDSWSSAATLPRFVEGAAMGAFEGKIYLMGGDDDFSPPTSNETNIYDIATDTWTGTGAPMPTGVSNAGFVQSGEFVYVVGGWGASSPGVNSDQTQRYDMSSDTWEIGPTFDLAVSDHALSGTDTALYVMGGDQNGGGFFEATDAVQRLDLSSWPGGTWTDLGDPLPTARQANSAGFCTTAFTGGEVWTTGGFFNFNPPITENLYRNTGEGCAGAVDLPWVSENPDEGVVPAGGSVVVDVLFDAGQVPGAGDYFGQLKIGGNAPGASPTVDLALHVIGGPGSCIYENDFNDTSQEWIEEKPTVTQPGDGFLHLSPLKRKAIAVADAAFGAQAVGTYTYTAQFTGGSFSKNWLYISRVDKKHQVEVLVKMDQGKVVIKDRNFAVAAKAKADFTFAPNTPYTFVINYDGTNIDLSIDGTPVITDFVPSRVLPAANTGAAAKLNDMLIDNFCFQ